MNERVTVGDLFSPRMSRRFRWLLLLAMLSFETASAATATLLRDVNVVMTQDGTVIEHCDVLVRGARIVSVSPTTQHREDDPQVTVVEGKGRYLLPGLAEMHVHLPPAAQAESATDMLFLFVAHGITTIRSTVGHPWHLQLREQIERGEVLGPRIHIAAPPLKADNTGNISELGARIKGYAGQRYDFLKLHPSLGRPAFDAIVSAAQSSGIPVEGHVPEAIGLARALDSRMRAIDHLDGYLQALADPNCAERPAPGSFFGIAYVRCLQMSRLPALLEQTKQAGTWIVPTLTHLETWTRLPDWEALAARPEMRYLPKATIGQWRTLHASLRASAPDTRRVDRFIAAMETILRQMQATGIPIVLGSDTPQAFNVPGASTLDELMLLVKAGLTPAQALSIATSNPARFIGAEREIGSVREGMIADLILIDANPLNDMGAVRQLRGVMVRGRWLDRNTIDGGLDAIAARAAAR